ncbi:histidinol-phosphate transaminase [uncultured Desulfovibrio sp.]|uniref:histidinol-phosphate transaminase n=1 Tax=uncultured Desulfovibrio sp. TaxID=167968 RepID=UPI002606E97F|nr:histidinol-phosphate transaminase [uncultured Desulfovibrio sp.]
MYTCAVRPEIASLSAYVPGMSIAEVRERYGLSRVIKMASNENPLGVSPLVRKVLATSLEEAFRYPQGGNPALREALARAHHVSPERIVVGNGSDEIIDMLIRMLAVPGKHSVVCFEPCFSLYPIQARICGVETRRCPLSPDYSFDLDALFSLVDAGTRLVFVTTPDNPSGYCPPLAAMRRLAEQLERHFPRCLLVVDEAYMDFAGASCGEAPRFSLLASGDLPANVAILRTFSKSYGLAGLRLGYGVLPAELAGFYWRARLPFSVNSLAEKAGLAVLRDNEFRRGTLECIRSGRCRLTEGLRLLGCDVWPSEANFLMIHLPEGYDASSCFEHLLQCGIIIRPLSSYGMPDKLRISIGTKEDNEAFLEALRSFFEKSF